ncbi:hypothetical protein, partial [uncultured Chloroflexus sp.]|uniref:hypothetical protein n=1 Tax=uncultured Chloroflexus sp. TaxID=214040 RepID=UPI002624AA56
VAAQGGEEALTIRERIARHMTLSEEWLLNQQRGRLDSGNCLVSNAYVYTMRVTAMEGDGDGHRAASESIHTIQYSTQI